MSEIVSIRLNFIFYFGSITKKKYFTRIDCLPLVIRSEPAFPYSIIPLACRDCDRK
jgi:hypothetical protein